MNAILCPFHEERTPSCIIEKERERFCCLSCRRQGTLKELEEKMQNVLDINYKKLKEKKK